MKQAFECNDDDIPFIDGGFNDRGRRTKKILTNPTDYPCNTKIEDALSENWQVKKAEPKELREAIETWIENANKMSGKPFGYNLLYVAYTNLKPPHR